MQNFKFNGPQEMEQKSITSIKFHHTSTRVNYVRIPGEFLDPLQWVRSIIQIPKFDFQIYTYSKLNVYENKSIKSTIEVR